MNVNLKCGFYLYIGSFPKIKLNVLCILSTNENRTMGSSRNETGIVFLFLECVLP